MTIFLQQTMNGGTGHPPTVSVQTHMERDYTFAEIWHAAATEKNFNHTFYLEKVLVKLLSGAMSVIGAFFVVFATLLICGVALAGFGLVLPAIATPNTLWFYFNVVWGESFLP